MVPGHVVQTGPGHEHGWDPKQPMLCARLLWLLGERAGVPVQVCG